MRKNVINLTALALTSLSTLVFQARSADKPGVPGYTDTPMLPSGRWHVHDPNRPVPPVVTPGATFSDAARPPADAIVLFSGHDLSAWTCEKGEVKWKVRDGCLEVGPHTGDIETKEKFGDFQLHLEWAEPAKVEGDSQARGNSGVFLHGLYEVQVLDSYNNPTYPDGQCGGLYGQSPPLVNACRKPGAWQTYDIIFEAPRFGPDHELIRPASATVIQNGILLHHKQAIIGPTGHRILAEYKKDTPERGPIRLQDHGNLVRFRNIWIRNIAEEEKP
jgi:hypothetical protein